MTYIQIWFLLMSKFVKLSESVINLILSNDFISTTCKIREQREKPEGIHSYCKEGINKNQRIDNPAIKFNQPLKNRHESP
jgi:hypothetical protein